MKKSQKLIQAAILSAVLVCGICIGVGAAGTSQQITASIEPNVTVTFDGAAQEFFDANGDRVYPILYNGSTYLPMRAVCEQLAGYKVGWDQATRTASIISKEVDGVDLLDMQRAYYVTKTGSNTVWAAHHMTSDKETTTVNGYTLTHWLTCQAYRLGDVSMGSFNIEGKYDTVTFRYYADKDATLEVIGDNEAVLWTKEIKGGQLYQEETVDLLKTNQLTFKFTYQDKNGAYLNGCIYDARLK